jgi:hypothetical protein
MSIVNYELTNSPCVNNPITRWHAVHGWIWNARDTRSGELLGVFYATKLCQDGVIIHFDTLIRVTPAQIFSGFKKGIRMLIPHCAVIYATVPAGSIALIRVLKHLGFRVVSEGGYVCEGKEMLLLKYFGSQNAIFL